MEKSTKALGYNSEFKQLEADGFKLIHMDKDERKIANLSFERGVFDETNFLNCLLNILGSKYNTNKAKLKFNAGNKMAAVGDLKTLR